MINEFLYWAIILQAGSTYQKGKIFLFTQRIRII